MIEKWEQAVRKSIIISGFCVILMGFVLPGEYFAKIFIGHPLFVIPFYFIISVLGWFLVGMPCYWLISKYTNGSSLYYILASVGVLVVSIVIIKNRLGIVIGLFSVFQCLLFLYILKRKSGTSVFGL